MITVDKQGNVQEPLLPNQIEPVVDEKGNTFGVVVNDEFVETGKVVNCGSFRMVLVPMDYTVARGNKSKGND